MSPAINIAVLDKTAIRCKRKESDGDGSWRKASKKRPRQLIMASEGRLLRIIFAGYHKARGSGSESRNADCLGGSGSKAILAQNDEQDVAQFAGNRANRRQMVLSSGFL